jgi:hypothetical protein
MSRENVELVGRLIGIWNQTGNFIGGATDRRETPSGQQTKMSLSMNGGAQVPAGGDVRLWCRVQSGFQTLDAPDDDDPARRVLVNPGL